MLCLLVSCSSGTGSGTPSPSREGGPAEAGPDGQTEAGPTEGGTDSGPVSTTDFTQYVNLVQGPGNPTNSDRQVIMRYPLGRIGLWSRGAGEIADAPTRGVRVYPMIDQIVSKDNADWRNTIQAAPAETDITYKTSSPAKGSTVALTVTPNVSVYKYHFNGVTSYPAIGITLGSTETAHGDPGWSNYTMTVVDGQTLEATLSSGSRTVYFYFKFSHPGTGGTQGNQLGYMKFSPSVKDVTVAVALSHSSMSTAQGFFTKEASDFDFTRMSTQLKNAWNAKLGKIDVQDADTLVKQELYTGLYSVYVNIINATDGSPYASYAAAYGSPILTVGSSPGWESVGGGYFRCAFDQGRVVYYLLTLIDPKLMTDILHTYQAQYDYNKVMLGNWDPYCPGCWSDQQWGFFGGTFLRAKLMGVSGVDYKKAETQIADTFGNSKNIMSTSQYLSRGYVPANIGVSNFMSRALEWSTDVQGLALLARSVGDTAAYNTWLPRGKNYKNNWNASSKVFQGKNSDGSWATSNTGFFEGSDKTYAFDVVHDPLGLDDLYGDSLMTSTIDGLLKPNMDYNDYLPIDQILPIYSNSPSTAENITRTRWVPEFKDLNMWEGYWSGSDVYYTDNSCVLVLTLLGLYPIQAPGAQYVITSPSVRKVVIHGLKDTTLEAPANSSSNIYISSIQLNGANYPSHFISGETLIKRNNTLTLGMTATASKIGHAYITGADGEVLAAASDDATYLTFQNDPVAQTSRARVVTPSKPTAVTVNGASLSSWTYDSTAHTVDMTAVPAGTVKISF